MTVELIAGLAGILSVVFAAFEQTKATPHNTMFMIIKASESAV
jgi:nicotinamide riboside transporter PnuC